MLLFMVVINFIKIKSKQNVKDENREKMQTYGREWCKGTFVGLHFGSALFYTKSEGLESWGNSESKLHMHLFCKHSFCAYCN